MRDGDVVKKISIPDRESVMYNWDVSSSGKKKFIKINSRSLREENVFKKNCSGQIHLHMQSH